MSGSAASTTSPRPRTPSPGCAEAASGPLTLLTATKELDLSQAAVLADLLRTLLDQSPVTPGRVVRVLSAGRSLGRSQNTSERMLGDYGERG